MADQAVVVLGCALRRGPGGALAGAAGRRAAAGARAYAERSRGDADVVVVASGGRAWRGEVEADALAAELVRCGVPDARIVREPRSRNTAENARFTAAILRARAIRRAVVVTCAWHVPRARALFAREGLEVDAVGAEAPRAGLAVRAWRWGRERLAARLNGVRA